MLVPAWRSRSLAVLAAGAVRPPSRNGATVDDFAPDDVHTEHRPVDDHLVDTCHGTEPCDHRGSTTVTIDGKKVAVPTDSGKPDSSDSDGDGQQIIISVGGFLPKRLYATPSDPVVWTNLTNQPQQVVFDHFAVHSPCDPSWREILLELT